MIPTAGAVSSRAARAVSALLIGLVFVACSPASPSSVAPSTPALPTAAPTVAPTVAATAAATASPSTATATGSAQPDPAAGLEIAAPYTLTALDRALETTFRDQFTKGAGAFGSLIDVGGRTANKDGRVAGYVIVLGFPAGILTESTFDLLLTGLGSSSTTPFTETMISGVPVAVGTAATANMGIFRADDTIVMTLSPAAAEVPEIAKALIDANP